MRHPNASAGTTEAPGGAGRAAPRTLRRGRVRSWIAIGLLLPSLGGCFHYVPASSSSVSPGRMVSVGLTDSGRVGIAPVLGSGVRTVRGDLLQRTDSALVLSVRSVEFLEAAGGWTLSGDTVALRRDLITDVRERRLSRPRTALLAGAMIVGGLLASTLAIVGFGNDPGSDRPGGGEPGSQ